MAHTILVCDDDKDTASGIRKNLTREGYDVVCVGDGDSAVLAVKSGGIDLVIMDRMMPDSDGDMDNDAGIYAAREIRRFSDVPILFLSAMGGAADRTLGLQAGGDDYVSKPFDNFELLERVRAILRRSRPQQSSKTNVYQSGALLLDDNKKIVMVAGEEKKLTLTEYQILLYLMSNMGSAFSPGQIYEAVWNEVYDYSSKKTVPVHIRHIREKIEVDTKNPMYLINKSGLGYSVVKL